MSKMQFVSHLPARVFHLQQLEPTFDARMDIESCLENLILGRFDLI